MALINANQTILDSQELFLRETRNYKSLSRGNDEDYKFTNPEKYKRVLAERDYM